MNDTIVTKKTLDASPNGCDCTFVKIGNAGMKIYTDDLERDEQFRLQGLFHKHGLAPDCWFIFDFEGPDGEMLYAYYSEVAEKTRPKVWYMDTDNKEGAISYGSEECEKWNYLAEQMAADLYDNYGITWEDDHGGNVGILNGKVVLIDFGRITGTKSL